jgi:restriction system protein
MKTTRYSGTRTRRVLGDFMHDFVGREAEVGFLLRWWEEATKESAYIYGPRGSGKTTLSEAVGREVGKTAPSSYINFGESEWTYQGCAPGVDSLRRHIEDWMDEVGPRRRALLSIERAETIEDLALQRLVADCSRRQPGCRFLLLGDRADPPRGNWVKLRLEPLPLYALVEVLRNGEGRLHYSAAHLDWIVDIIQARPEIEQIVRQRVESEGPMPTLRLFEAARFDESVLLATVHRNGTAQELTARVAAVSDDLLRRLARDPSLVRSLAPRHFEELVAELYARQGFEVELTPATRDAGVDLFVVQHTAFGRLLTVVDCKRYRPDRPVGVRLVREMLGTVEAQGASAGVLVTTSHFTLPAVELSQKYPFRIGLQDYFNLCFMLESMSGDSSPR